jgi:hypothetical protein
MPAALARRLAGAWACAAAALATGAAQAGEAGRVCHHAVSFTTVRSCVSLSSFRGDGCLMTDAPAADRVGQHHNPYLSL